MRLAWLINNFADPGLKLTPDQRRAADRIVHERNLRARLLSFTLIVVVPPPLIAVGATGLIDDWLGAQLGISTTGANAILIAAVVIATWPWSAWLYGRFYTVPYRRAIRDVGVRICIACGYDLEGLPAPATCPECGGREPTPPTTRRAEEPTAPRCTPRSRPKESAASASRSEAR